VLEGSFTTEMLAVELENLLPGKTKWEIEEKGKDSFSTNFPSSDWLATIVNWGTMDTKIVQGKIKFEKSVEDDVYKYEIEKVWVQFKGLPKELREFPIIWPIASILGVPRAVDTKFTKAFGRARMKVAVDTKFTKFIPVFVDVVIGDDVFHLHFGVEQGGQEGEPVLLDLESTMEDEDPQNEFVGKEVDDPKNNEIGDTIIEINGENEEQPPKGQKEGGSDGGSLNKINKKNANSKSAAILTTVDTVF